MNKNYKIGSRTAMALVISSMVGTGVFTSLGYQLASVQNTWTIIILWVLGGFIALIGAFTYAELGTHFKGNGGEETKKVVETFTWEKLDYVDQVKDAFSL